ncbi:NAD(P)H-binding protein [Spiribacter halobius]|uniref:NAD(P)H-binding protein n=1 Tax=Sediminicurvatus halobius TaxID=2182432 RepID=UPI001E4B436A|nr:NAD(P)H-binding protein [Spiribacter halobius]UEX76307.1 NAD(P)H-binding protein [Spiribacter halobius]
MTASHHGLRIIVAGATGYIGRHVARELIGRGHRVVSLARATRQPLPPELAGSEVRTAEVCDSASLAREGFAGEPVDAVVSCIASRSGGITDAWRVDYAANRKLLAAARAAGVRQFLLLSAICVQKPRLAFQHAKLAFEQALQASELNWTIVRPTAFYKSLAGQVPRVRAGKPYLLFGDGGTACRPISERDLAAFMADCLENPSRQRRILPIGGPDPALTARERGELLFELTGRRPRFRRIPIRLLDTLIPTLDALACAAPRLSDKAEFARIARYYATEDMLWLDPATGRYDAAATPATGRDTLSDFYRRVLREGMAGQELGEQGIF